MEKGNNSSLQLLFTMLPGLPDTEATIARYILLEPAKAKNMTAKELVAECGVGEATVFRLCQRLGCTFSELKRGIDADGTNPLLTEAPRDGDLDDVLRHAQERVFGALKDTIDFLDMAKVEKAIEILRQGEKIFVCGTGPISGNIAEMTAFKLQEVGLTALPWSDNRAPETVTSICTSRDVILGLSHSGESKELGRMLELVSGKTVRSIVITNYQASTAASYADVVLATAVREVGLYQTDLVPRFGLLFIIEILLEALDPKKSTGLLRRSFFAEPAMPARYDSSL